MFFSQSVTFEEYFWLSKRALFGPLLERFGPPVDARYRAFWPPSDARYTKTITNSSLFLFFACGAAEKIAPLPELFIFPSGFFF